MGLGLEIWRRVWGRWPSNRSTLSCWGVISWKKVCGGKIRRLEDRSISPPIGMMWGLTAPFWAEASEWKIEKHDPNLNSNCVEQYQSKKKCSTLVFRKCYNLSRSCTSHHLCTGLKKLLVTRWSLSESWRGLIPLSTYSRVIACINAW